MARYTILFLLSLLLLLSTACERPVPPPTGINNGAYNLSAYLQQQIQRLQQKQPMVLKSVKTRDEPTETVETAEVNWKDELAMFEELDLSKPTLQEYYTRTDSLLPDGSTSIRYNRLPDAEALVHYVYLRVGKGQQLQHLQALVQDQNILFFTRRKLQLTADPANGNLQSYRIEGVQKLIFGDTLRYRVDTNL